MFTGHYAAAFAAKVYAPKAPLWSYVLAAQALDVGLSLGVLAGLEKIAIVPGQPGSALDLYHMPWTHSLPAAVIWGGLIAALAKHGFRQSGRVALVLGAVVLAHWGLDYLAHRPDLALWPGGPKVGLGLWNMPDFENTLEIGLVGLTGALWVALRVREGKKARPAMMLLTLLLVMHLIYLVVPIPTAVSTFAVLTMALTGLVVFSAWWAEAVPQYRGLKPETSSP